MEKSLYHYHAEPLQFFDFARGGDYKPKNPGRVF
jgi:hypothetical protein